MHGYQLIQEIAERSGGAWRPSPGAVYPALSLLEDEGLVAIASESGRKQATLTEAGTAYVSENADALGDPWQAAAERGGDSARTLRTAFEGIADAARQVARSGSESQAKSAEAILDKARRDLYLVLAGEAETPGDSEG
jgi:DNA-binding PadR family transcriptional regulator